MTFCWLPQILTHQLLRLHNYTPHYLFLINFIMFIFSFGYPRYFFFPLPFCLYPFLMVEVEPLLSLSLSHMVDTHFTYLQYSLAPIARVAAKPQMPKPRQRFLLFHQQCQPKWPKPELNLVGTSLRPWIIFTRRFSSWRIWSKSR